MASVQCHKTAEKGLNQGYYGGSTFGQKASDMANWACKATKRENKYQGAQNGYAMAYREGECYGSQIHYPNHGMKESQTAYGMVEFREDYGRSYNGSHKSQNENAMSKTKVHGHGHGSGGHSSDGVAQFQGYGSSNHASPGTGRNHGYGYGYGSTHGNQKNSGGMGQGFSGHTNFEKTEAYAHDQFETDDRVNYRNNRMGMAQSQGNRHGKHSGHGLTKPRAHGPGKNMSYEISESETYFYETHYSDESHFCGGAHGGKPKNMGNHSARALLGKVKDGISGNSRCSDDDSESDYDEYGRRKVWISKAL